jgi:preprotein translocase subunit SecY
MIAGVQNIGRIQELRQRIFFTFGMLAVYRIGAYIVTPGIDPEVVRNFFAQMQGTIFGLFTLFSGGRSSSCRSSRWASCPTSARRSSSSCSRS